jgi:hypothetical protein
MGVCIFSTINQVKADLLKGALDENNIDCFLENYHSNAVGIGGLTVPFAGTNLVTGDIKVIVKDEDVEKSLEIVKALFGEDKKDLSAEYDNISEVGCESKKHFADSNKGGISRESSEPKEIAIAHNLVGKSSKKLNIGIKLFIAFFVITFVGNFISSFYSQSAKYGNYSDILLYSIIERIFSILNYVNLALSLIILYKQKSKIALIIGLLICVNFIVGITINTIGYTSSLRYYMPDRELVPENSNDNGWVDE